MHGAPYPDAHEAEHCDGSEHVHTHLGEAKEAVEHQADVEHGDGGECDELSKREYSANNDDSCTTPAFRRASASIVGELPAALLAYRRKKLTTIVCASGAELFNAADALTHESSNRVIIAFLLPLPCDDRLWSRGAT